MADKGQPKKPESGVPTPQVRTPSRSQQLNRLYSLPAPLRTFPLPSFVPHNPISLFHILYTWVSQTISVLSSHPDIPYQGWLSEETRSVHVTDPRSIRALWEQGFYGKGSLSRSEPSWLEREKSRRGVAVGQTSEEVTKARRAERQQIKWERARKEREAINKKLLEERGSTRPPEALSNRKDGTNERSWPSPVGPMELLALPNSILDLESFRLGPIIEENQTDKRVERVTNGLLEDHSALHRLADLPDKADSNILIDETSNKVEPTSLGQNNANGSINSSPCLNGLVSGATYANGSAEPSKQAKGQKSVRFSPKVEQTTFLQSEPPSPELAATSLVMVEEPPVIIQDREHLQLTMEESFFLCYGLGVLTVSDRKSNSTIPTKDLLSIFRRYSHFQPQETPLTLPDDPFMVSYVVYHHFRSLGWVVRGGTKFSVDYLLYNRGPVFSHAEFAVLILPSYSDPSWSMDTTKRDYVAKMEKRRWPLLHCINRVNNQVQKTLVLVYVDIPPLSAHIEDGLGIDGILKRYKIREFVLKRWNSNRSRD